MAASSLSLSSWVQALLMRLFQGQSWLICLILSRGAHSACFHGWIRGRFERLKLASRGCNKVGVSTLLHLCHQASTLSCSLYVGQRFLLPAEPIHPDNGRTFVGSALYISPDIQIRPSLPSAMSTASLLASAVEMQRMIPHVDNEAYCQSEFVEVSYAHTFSRDFLARSTGRRASTSNKGRDAHGLHKKARGRSRALPALPSPPKSLCIPR